MKNRALLLKIPWALVRSACKKTAGAGRRRSETYPICPAASGDFAYSE